MSYDVLCSLLKHSIHSNLGVYTISEKNVSKEHCKFDTKRLYASCAFFGGNRYSLKFLLYKIDIFLKSD